MSFIPCAELVGEPNIGLPEDCAQHAIGYRHNPEDLDHPPYPVCINHARPPMAPLRALSAPDPMDEDDKRDRIDAQGDRWAWDNDDQTWHLSNDWIEFATLKDLASRYGPLTFAPQPPPEATDGDLRAKHGTGEETEGVGETKPDFNSTITRGTDGSITIQLDPAYVATIGQFFLKGR